MNGTRFDELTSRLAAQHSRRGLMRVAGAMLATSAFAARFGHAAAQGATPGATPATDCPATTEAQNEAIARRWSEDTLTGRDLSVLSEIAAPDMTWDAGVFPVLRGRRQVSEALQALLDAFPDGRYTVDQVVAKGDLVAVRWTARGTHQGRFLGVPATGNQVVFTGINIYRIACGKIAGGYSEADGVAVLEQIGLLPTTPAAAAQPSPIASPAMIATPAAGCAASTEAENEDVVRRYLDAWGSGDPAAFADLLTPNMVHHWGQGADTTGVAAYQQQVSQFFTAFPDLDVTLDLLFGQGDLIVARWTATGTHQGEFFDLPPTGKTVTWTGTNIFRFACGQIAESWSETDGLGIRRQLGVLPDTVATPAS